MAMTRKERRALEQAREMMQARTAHKQATERTVTLAFTRDELTTLCDTVREQAGSVHRLIRALDHYDPAQTTLAQRLAVRIEFLEQHMTLFGTAAYTFELDE